jgi:hypothetical protein
MSTSPSAPAIEFVEVGPRDGLQNEKTLIATAEFTTTLERANDL